MSRLSNNPAQKEILLSIRDLHIKGFSENKWHPIIKGVDANIHRGEILGLIGESGAGKSTLGLAAMGHTKAGCKITSGSILFDGVELAAAKSETLRRLRGARIAYVAQSAAASFNPAYKLIRQYAEAPVLHKVMSRAEAEADAIALYQQMRLPNPEAVGFRFPHQVSGGQLQRAMTAMAMSCRPDLIIFDEPTTALDVTTQIQVLAAIRDIVSKYNTAAIYITHDLAVVAQMADRIKVLRYGEEVEEAETRQMLQNPTQEYTKSLWAVRNFQRTLHIDNNAIEDSQILDDYLLEVRGLSAAYSHSINVLNNITLNIPRGKTVAIVGESGSGKSTTARCITGLLPPIKGQILFNGQTLSPMLKGRSKDLLRRIQMIHQMADTALNPKHRIRDILGRPLTHFLQLTGTAKHNRLHQLMTMIEMDPEQFLDRFPDELSGGQKQRICIARALAAEPDFIICDEVTSALDQLVAEGILRLLDKLQRELNLTYIFITHDLATVKSIADDVVVMLNGEVVEQGPKDRVLQPPHHAYTQKLLSSVPEMDPDWLDNVLANELSSNRNSNING